MASELRVNTLKDAAGNNSIATSFVAGGSAKAWVFYNNLQAISDSFSLTTIISVDTILNEATAITDSKIINKMDFVILIEKNKFE